MQHGIEAAGEHAARVRSQGALLEPRAGRHGVSVPGGQVIEHDHLVAVGDELGAHHAADVTGAAGDE